jgi:apolipoprotein N-acyltransferase
MTTNRLFQLSFLNVWQKLILCIISFALVAFGQPAWSSWCAFFASLIGYAIFWRVLLEYPQAKARFWFGTAWFTAVQLVQFSWFISHPYHYIYSLYFLVSLALGIQFGLICLFIQSRYLSQYRGILAIAGMWTLMEWARLFFLSGLTFNPIGLAMSANLYSLQFASLIGIYGLTYWVILVNLLALKTWCQGFSWKPALLWGTCALLPFIYGGWQLSKHEEKLAALAQQPDGLYKAVLVQTSFPIEETMEFKTPQHMVQYVMGEWRQILKITKKNLNTTFDLLVLPEFVVPYGTYSFVFPSFVVTKAFSDIYGKEVLPLLPPMEEPLAMEVNSSQGKVWMVNNAYWVQALANIFQADVIAGLEDAEDVTPGKREYYSSAIHFQPMGEENPDFGVTRYNKRVLVPMGEYIPFTFLAKLAESYGISGSLTHGKEPKVIDGKKKLGLSICYEETYGHLMRENKQKGAEILVNLTSDAWYPNSRLNQQHFDLGKLRTVENGIPLIRACNTGITSAIDSLGRTVARLGKEHENVDSISDSLAVEVPTYIYPTLYSNVGDYLIIGISIFSIFLCLAFPIKINKNN